jgi:3-oxoacyl-[acyl-carrier-protein] synthase-3
VYLPGGIQRASDAVADGRYSQEDFEENEIVSVPIAGDMPAPEMGLRAANQALAQSEVDPAEIGLIIYTGSNHQGPDGWGPAAYIQAKTGCTEAISLEVRHQCNGMFSSLHLAVSHLRAAPEHTAVLIVGADNWASPLLDRWNCTAGMVLGDAATAIVLTKQPGFARLRSVDMVAVPELEEMHRSGEPLFPPTVLTGRVLDFRVRSAHFAKTSPYAGQLRELLTGANARLNARTEANAGVELSKVTRIGHVNASPEIVRDRLLPMFGIPVSRSTYDLTRHVGHLGVSDQIHGLDLLLRGGFLSAGDHYLMAGVGPGVTFGTSVVEIIDRPAWFR